MASPTDRWIALAGTPELPILEAPVLAAAGEDFAVSTVALPYKPLSPEETCQWAREFQGAVAILLRSGYMTASLLDRLPDLKVVAVHGAGVDPVDIGACTARGVLVTNTPGANADAVAELAIGLMLALLRRIPDAAHKTYIQRQWDSARHTGGELKGRVLGLAGLGKIGQRVARIGNAFGMLVTAHDPALSDEHIQDCGVTPVSFDRLVADADILSLHVPAIPETRHMINAAVLDRMKPEAILINCARGSLVDEHALARALTDGRFGGAALDVLEGEPPEPQSPIYGAPNLVLTPHMGGSTNECLHGIAAAAGADIVRVLKGEQPLYPVNKPVKPSG